MAPTVSLVNKLKVQLKLSISRLRMVQQKDSAKVKQQRREMAQLIEVGKVQSARIRVENIIRTDITTELHEILELYCELLLARSQLLESQVSSSNTTSASTSTLLDPALEEAVRSIIYAAPRTEIKELHTVRALLVDKFGKDVALASMEGEGVAERVMKKLKVETPKEELVEAYMTEIARFYGVPYGTVKSEDEDEDDDDEPSGGVAEKVDLDLEDPISTDDSTSKKAEEREALAKASTPKKLGPQSPLRVVPPSPSTDNVAPRLKLPGSAAAKIAKSEANTKKPAKKEDGLGKIPDVDELSRRFAELKR
ncbi:regulator of Vps4 activity in the MVB pathway-domain-containing protein [Alternaria rosae]|uniref:regulator of Vps4 activity in the MVB pathway-domain-containing protein n=1 Tax=Alternaria rosae TaxID=1187941 RepID=UPI001E8CD323|nr:regulator of Vps4 activity in the MVB pathway-domain-containing protein [Alternaria rosae]KAH6882010.1 regulator of Vps4 activity in the MVB pathway-domain-containing protein [Alternaria rosae]